MSQGVGHSFIGRYSSSSLLFLRAVTPLHVGVGRAGGVVDLPVQRDLYGYPVIYSSSLKGAFRSECMRRANNGGSGIDKGGCEKLFGSQPEVGETKPGKIAVLDAYPFLIPVRLLRGVYGYVTSPFLLYRMIDYLELIDKEKADKLRGAVEEASKTLDNPDKALVVDAEKYTVSSDNDKYIIVNEEFWLKPAPDKNGVINNILDILNEELKNKLCISDKNLFIVPDIDDVSLNIIERSLIRLQRVRLKTEEKIVDRGALWSEEYLPRNAVLYTAILYADENAENNFNSIFLDKNGKGYVILGGHETIGKGLTELYRASIK